MDTAAIKQRLSMRDVAARLGFEPNRAGYIRCPLHGDSDPSLKLYDDDRGWYCFGCQKGGDVIDFIGAVQHVSFTDALRTAAAMAGVQLDKPMSDWERQRHAAKMARIKRKYLRKERADDQRIALTVELDRLQTATKTATEWNRHAS